MAQEADEVDRIVEAWTAQRPDLDFSPLGVLSRVDRLSRHLDRARRDAFRRSELEPWEWDVLSALRRAGEPFQLSPKQLLQQTLVSSGTMTNRIDRLVGRRLVRRENDPDDGRSILVTLTEDGRVRVDAAITRLVDAEALLLAALPRGDRERLAALLRKLSLSFDVSGGRLMAHLLGAEALHLEFPTKVVFDSVSLGVDEGDRIGIVGRNGDGKSSLLAMLAGRLEPNAGRVTRRGGVRVGVLDQGDTLDDSLTIREAVVGDTPDHEWAGDARVRDVIAGLLTDLDWDGSVAPLSGGQRRRVALARLLTGDWDVLALDEPTNHLDVEGIAWLAEHLKRRWSRTSGALLVVTHDRWFLDEVCTATWEVHDGLVDPFEGGYAAYILQRVERDRQSASIEARRQNLARKELAWLRRGAPARTSKPKFRIDAANELIADVPEIRDKIALQSLAVSRLGKDVVDLLDVSVTYDEAEPSVLRDIEWRLAPGERTGILGVNGAGKSTLLGLISGTVQPTSGRVKRGKTVQVATLTQRIDNLQPHLDEPVRVVIASLRTSYVFGSGSKAQELTPGQLLERLGFQSAQLSTPVKDLSGGQQRRLQLLLILLEQPNVLILDEPTNDLDTDMLAALEDLLDSWPGTLIVVSHDRYFIERVTDQQYAIFDGHLRHLPGGLEEYLRVRTAQRAKADAAPPRPSATGAAASGAAAAPALSGAERRTAEKELSAIDRRLGRLQSELDTVDVKLAESHDDYSQLLALQERRTSASAEVAQLEERWLKLSETLES